MSSEDQAPLNTNSAPKHIAIIMDGNGRWAKAKHLPRAHGHQKGVQTVREIVKHCAKIGVDCLTLFAFSSENMKRSSEEVGVLFKLFLTVLKQETRKLNNNNIRLTIIGDMSVFSTEIQALASDAEQLLSHNTGLNLVIAANYGGQWDIAQAAKKIAVLASEGQLQVDDIDIDVFGKHTALAGLPIVDLLIRTSGEIRVSNFLLWDIAYSELFFTNTLWPDFGPDELDKAILSFHSRDRRFGARKDEN
jgi:undecaprenyl diphosphate synthase